MAKTVIWFEENQSVLILNSRKMESDEETDFAPRESGVIIVVNHEVV